MSLYNLLQNLPSLDSIVVGVASPLENRDPLTVYPDLPLLDAIAMMSQQSNNIAAPHRAMLVVEKDLLVGIVTDRDLVKLTTTQANLQGLKVADVITEQPHRLVLAGAQTVLSAVSILQQYEIDHLPIVDAQGHLLGLVTIDLIRQIFQPTALLKSRCVGEVMTAKVIYATVTATILQVAQLMVEYSVSSIVIVDSAKTLQPLGIVTERDIVQFQMLELDFRLSIDTVMSTPLLSVQPEDSLQSAQQMMDDKQIRRLGVTGAAGELVGIVTESNLLGSIDPLSMLRVIDILQVKLIDRATESDRINLELSVEIARRAQVEAQLRRAKQNLERQEVTKTSELGSLTAQLQTQIAEQQSCSLALEMSQQGISDFIDNATIGLHWLDPEGMTVWVNQAELTMLGYDREEYIGRPQSDFHVEREAMGDLFDRLLKNESITGYPAQMRRKDGSICHVLIDANPFFKDGKFIHSRCFTRDISEQTNAETALKQTLTLLEFHKYALARSAIVVITDRDGTIVEVNDRFCQICQYSELELLDKNVREIESSYHPPAFFQDLWAVISSGKVWSGEIKNRAKDGSFYWVATTIVSVLDALGQPLQYLSIHFDITQAKREESIRQQTEDSLRTSETRFQTLLTAAPIGIFQSDAEGNCLFMNQQCLQIMGATLPAVLGRGWGNFVHPDDRPWVLAQWQETLATKDEFDADYRFVTPQGQINWVRVNVIATYDKAGDVNGYLGTVLKISDSQPVAVAQTRDFSLLSTAPVGLFQTDAAGSSLFINPHCLALMGITLAEGLDQGWANFLHPDDRQQVFAEWDEAVLAEREFVSEHRFVTPQARVNWVNVKAVATYDEAGIVTGYIGTLIDITDRKTAEQKILEQAALLNVATDAITMCDLENRIQFWNHGAECLYGWQVAEVMGLNKAHLFHLDKSPAAVIALNTVRTQGAWQGELHKLTKADKEVVVESRWTLIHDESGQPKSILCVDTDVTGKQLLERQFLRAQRLESLGTLASGIAHDLNNVLTPILGAAQLLPQTLPSLNERNQRLLAMLVESSRRGSCLVKQILTFARGMDGERTTIQVKHILAEIISIARQTFPKSIEIQLSLATEDLWMVSVDATQIHQVLMNLFVNARDAMPNGGSITASAQNLVLDAAAAKLHNVDAGSYLNITIADTGVGIAKEQLDRIFDPFFTTKATGTGLGLSTVLGIITSHSGAIHVYSEIEIGTRFNIYLPAAAQSEDKQPIETPALFDGNGQLVLVVDDEAAICEIAKASLEAYNYRVILASDGIKAIDLYDRHRDEISIVMLDMMMPHLDTPSIIGILKQMNPNVKIVLMSGLASNESIVSEYKLKAFLTKPFTMTDMLGLLQDVDKRSTRSP
jgi:PAS domain S-box-containing protein